MESKKKENFKGAQITESTPILIIGDNCKDKFIYGHSDRLCPEAPVPVFKPTGDVTINDGMAGNVASNIRGLGYECRHIKNTGEITKTRYIDYRSNQMLLRVDDHDYTDRIHLQKLNIELIKAAPLIIISDYNKGFLTEDDIKYILALNANCFLDTKKRLRSSWCEHVKYIKINELEYIRTADTLSKKLEDKVIVTLGGKGCMYRGRIYKPTKVIQTVDVSGAGDTFMAALATRWFETKNIESAINFANDCALAVIQERGVTSI